MATDGPTPPPCDTEIFAKGGPFMAIDGSSNAVERFIVALRNETNTRVDWHYSGGVAQVLFLGTPVERGKLLDAVYERLHKKDDLLKSLRIMKIFAPDEGGLYRAGVTETPEGAIGAYYEPGNDESTFIVEK